MTEPRTIALDDLVGTAEIADALNVSINTVQSWIQRRIFPERLITRTGQPLWDWAVVRAWAIETDRLDPEAPWMGAA